MFVVAVLAPAQPACEAFATLPVSAFATAGEAAPRATARPQRVVFAAVLATD